MAIFSQSSEKTKEDFRNYDYLKPNRTVRYQLPRSVESKLILLMEELGYNSGSIDIIKGVDGKYYFLEVNPNGQFGMISSPCNYNLEEIVANHLINQQNG